MIDERVFEWYNIYTEGIPLVIQGRIGIMSVDGERKTKVKKQ